MFFFKNKIKDKFFQRKREQNQIIGELVKKLMFFGIYEHIIVIQTLILIFTRNTRFFYTSVIITLAIQLFFIDYLRTKEEKIPDCSKYTFRVFGKIWEACVSVKQENNIE